MIIEYGKKNKFRSSLRKNYWRYKMDDKLVMTNILDSTKSICNLLNQGTIESNENWICEWEGKDKCPDSNKNATSILCYEQKKCILDSFYNIVKIFCAIIIGKSIYTIRNTINTLSRINISCFNYIFNLSLI